MTIHIMHKFHQKEKKIIMSVHTVNSTCFSPLNRNNLLHKLWKH